MKLLRSTKSKTTKNKNGGNIPCLEIKEVVLMHCNVVNPIQDGGRGGGAKRPLYQFFLCNLKDKN